MVVTPNSRVILLKSPLKLDNYNQITFDSVASQFNYFYNLPKIEEWNYTYVRKDGVLRVETSDNLTFEDLLEYNYCMYQNTHYDNKWFYAFVTNITYMNDGMTEVQIETDPFQTWQFEIDYKNSFIEREHVSDDTIGLHTIPEGLEIGEYVVSGVQETVATSDPLALTYTCVGVTWLPDDTPFYSQIRTYGKTLSGANYLLFKTQLDATNFIKSIDKLGRDAGGTILSIFEVPQALTGVSGSDEGWFSGRLGEGNPLITAHLLPSFIYRTLIETISVTSPSTLNGYTPKNNKCFVYPYNAFKVTNNAGMETEFRYEDFVNNNASFTIAGTFSPGCSMTMYPKNYKKNSTTNGGYNWSIPIAKIPLGSWSSDPYTNWLTQTGVNILGHRIEGPTAKAMMGTVQSLVGGITGNYESTLEGFGNMFGAVQENYRHSMESPTVNGQLNSGDITYAIDKAWPTIYKMTIRSEYAQIIDNWFTMYGYKVNRLATPNIHKRSNWDYIKCIQVNLEGNIPEKDLDSIRSLFNNGCTFWHTTTYYLDYSRTNSIL